MYLSIKLLIITNFLKFQIHYNFLLTFHKTKS